MLPSSRNKMGTHAVKSFTNVAQKYTEAAETIGDCYRTSCDLQWPCREDHHQPQKTQFPNTSSDCMPNRSHLNFYFSSLSRLDIDFSKLT